MCEIKFHRNSSIPYMKSLEISNKKPNIFLNKKQHYKMLYFVFRLRGLRVPRAVPFRSFMRRREAFRRSGVNPRLVCNCLRFASKRKDYQAPFGRSKKAPNGYFFTSTHICVQDVNLVIQLTGVIYFVDYQAPFGPKIKMPLWAF